MIMQPKILSVSTGTFSWTMPWQEKSPRPVTRRRQEAHVAYVSVPSLNYVLSLKRKYFKIVEFSANADRTSQTALLAAHRMANQVQACLLNLQSITRGSSIPRRPFTVSQAHEVHAFICQSLTFSSTVQPFIWFSCFSFSYLCTKNNEFPTSSHSVVSNTLFL